MHPENREELQRRVVTVNLKTISMSIFRKWVREKGLKASETPHLDPCPAPDTLDGAAD
jgi:hypothetical protein